MSRWSARGRPYNRRRAAFLASYTTCHICGHSGADTIDHIIPASAAPTLRDSPDNWRAAHGVNGCPVCGRACNQERGNRPGLPSPRRSRRW